MSLSYQTFIFSPSTQIMREKKDAGEVINIGRTVQGEVGR
jgi:hypothetical protein